MALIEVQIRTDRLCKLIEGEVNSRPLPGPTSDYPPIAGKLLEWIECRDCVFIEKPNVWAHLDLIAFQCSFVFHYYESLEDELRPAGSFGVGTPSTESARMYVGLQMIKGGSNDWRIEYQLLLADLNYPLPGGILPVGIPRDIAIGAAQLTGTEELVTIRMATDAADLSAPIVNKLGAAEWCQTVQGELIAQQIRKVLDAALDDAVRPPVPPPSWEWWKPTPKHQKLRKDWPATAAWFPLFLHVSALSHITAVDVKLGFDIGVELSLIVKPEVTPGNGLRMVARFTWDAEDEVLAFASGLLLGIPVGIAVAKYIEDEVSDEILGKNLGAGGFHEVARDDESITFERIGGPPSPPSREFEITTVAVVLEGLRTSGTIRPKKRAELRGTVTPPEAGTSIDCNIREVALKLSPAEVVLWSLPGDNRRLDVNPKPIVFERSVIFHPADAWQVEAKDILRSMAPASSTPGDVVIRLKDHPVAGRLPAGTVTSMYLPTNLGVRWVDLGTIPELNPELLPAAEDLMQAYCDSITNPWAGGLTKLEWVDPLLDPDYEHRDRMRFWTLSMQDLPVDAQIEVVATGASGQERLVGVVEGMKDVVIEVVTNPKEVLALRVGKQFHAPRPTVARGWFVPTRGIANQEHYVCNNMLGTTTVDEPATHVIRKRVDWAVTSRLKTGERLVEHDKKLIVGVVRGMHRIQ